MRTALNTTFEHKAVDAQVHNECVLLTVIPDLHGLTVKAEGSDTDIVFDVAGGEMRVYICPQDGSEPTKIASFIY